MTLGNNIMKRFYILLLLGVAVTVSVSLWRSLLSDDGVAPEYEVGDKQGELNGVIIYYNGDSSVSSGRNLTSDGYNLGLRYQCVEFVKRYYYERLSHRMPESWGHAKDFFDPNVSDGSLNKPRGLLQFKNGGGSKPRPDDLIVFGPSESNSYGHVAIVSKVSASEIEIAQQNSGPKGKPRVTIDLNKEGETWLVDNIRVLGWLRKR